MTTSLTAPLAVAGGLPGFPSLRMGAEINHGYFGRVYRAFDPKEQRDFAIKVVEKTRLNEKQRQNVRNEVMIMRMLVHKNIIRLYADVETETHFVLKMELMRGGDLFERLEKLTVFNENDARAIITQVAEGIAYMHSRNVAHRDIKIENLMFTAQDSNDLKIGDFGLAKLLVDSNGETITPVGTREYMAPEMFTGSHYSKSVDMWALGCLTYIVLFGGFPFYNDEDDRGKTVRSLKDKIREGKYDFPTGNEPGANVSEWARDIIRKCLTVDGKKRITINDFLQHRWIRGNQALPAVLNSPAVLREAQRVVSLRDIFRVGVNFQRAVPGPTDDTSKPIAQRGSMRLGPVTESGILGRRQQGKRKAEEGDGTSSGVHPQQQERATQPNTFWSGTTAGGRSALLSTDSMEFDTDLAGSQQPLAQAPASSSARPPLAQPAQPH